MPHIHPLALESSRLIWLLCAVAAIALVVIVREFYRGFRK